MGERKSDDKPRGKKDTNGAFFLVEAMLAPGSEPPPHLHTREDELFYVLEGEFDVYVGKEAFKVETGECVFLPRFKPHAFVIRSRRPNMKGSHPHEIPFTGVRLRFDSEKSFDEVLSSLFADVGDKPFPISEVATNSESWDEYKKEIESHVGPSGFSLFAIIDHGAWIKKVGIQRKVLRLIIGNPTIAITMLRHDLTAGLFAPVELILVEEGDGHCSLTYVRPSSLMVVEKNDALLSAAKQLDSKLQALAEKVTNA